MIIGSQLGSHGSPFIIYHFRLALQIEAACRGWHSENLRWALIHMQGSLVSRYCVQEGIHNWFLSAIHCGRQRMMGEVGGKADSFPRRSSPELPFVDVGVIFAYGLPHSSIAHVVILQ